MAAPDYSRDLQKQTLKPCSSKPWKLHCFKYDGKRRKFNTDLPVDERSERKLPAPECSIKQEELPAHAAVTQLSCSCGIVSAVLVKSEALSEQLNEPVSVTRLPNLRAPCGMVLPMVLMMTVGFAFAQDFSANEKLRRWLGGKGTGVPWTEP